MVLPARRARSSGRRNSRCARRRLNIVTSVSLTCDQRATDVHKRVTNVSPTCHNVSQMCDRRVINVKRVTEMSLKYHQRVNKMSPTCNQSVRNASATASPNALQTCPETSSVRLRDKPFFVCVTKRYASPVATVT